MTYGIPVAAIATLDDLLAFIAGQPALRSTARRWRRTGPSTARADRERRGGNYEGSG